MTRKGSIKETGEELPGKDWRRFEAAVGVGEDGKHERRVQTDQPYRDEVERPDIAGGDTPRPDDAGDPDRKQQAPKTTQRTE